MKYPSKSDSCFCIDVIEAIVSNQVDQTNPLEASLLHDDSIDSEDCEAKSYLMWMDLFEPNMRKYFETLGEIPSRPIPSIEKPPSLEEKQLPPCLHYAYLGPSSTLSVIISFLLSSFEEYKLIIVLRDHKATIS